MFSRSQDVSGLHLRSCCIWRMSAIKQEIQSCTDSTEQTAELSLSAMNLSLTKLNLRLGSRGRPQGSCVNWALNHYSLFVLAGVLYLYLYTVFGKFSGIQEHFGEIWQQSLTSSYPSLLYLILWYLRPVGLILSLKGQHQSWGFRTAYIFSLSFSTTI